MQKGALYLVALSGGADSVALLLAVKRLGYRVEAVHCNFHLRGEESDRDEQFCRQLCYDENVKLHVVHFDTISYAQLHKQSIEMAARNLRYAYFHQLAKDINAQGICVGHHIEDSVETLLINLVRGTGINGLTGISVKNGIVVRPMLEVSRDEIEDFLKRDGKTFVTDSTNLVDDVTRNRIRLNIMPQLREINPSVDRDIAKTAQRLNEANKVFVEAINKACNDCTELTAEGTIRIDVEKLLKQTSPQYTLFTILSRFAFTPSAIEQIYGELPSLTNGALFESKTHRMAFDRGYLLIQPMERKPLPQMKMPETGTYVYSEKIKIKIAEESLSPSFTIVKDKQTATLDATHVKFPLTVRPCRQGDWFVPFGMKGKKLLSDYMTDRKFSLFQKERQLVVTDATGCILWLVGERSDNRFRVSAETERIVTIKVL